MLCTAGITDAKTCHGIGLADTVDEQCLGFDRFAERSDAGMLAPVENKLVVDFVRNDVKSFFDR